jgi:hypothetical protein
MAESYVVVAHAFRCLEADHVFVKQLPSAGPKVLRQTATCPEHHCAAIAIEPEPA